MARTKIDYGIDLGTTNSAISRMEKGEPVIKKTDTLKDTMPSCVYINKKKAIQVGDSAYNALKREKLKLMKTSGKAETNAFIEFKRTMGTEKKYKSSHLDKELLSEELSAEVLKTLKSFIGDENFHSAVITVPAAFKINQIDATRKAAKLAGFKQIQVLQEPVAASMAYGLNSEQKDGYWLVFDFGGGTFDSALLKVEDGIMKVIDTEGDNYLGGKDLDYAVVDKIIIPYIEENFSISSIKNDNNEFQALRDAMKFYGEEAKIKLSFNETYNILSDLGDIPGEDDDGEEFELDITVNQDDIKNALAPVFQKAIDICLELLKRNNLQGSSLDTLLLVGGPTHSPILRKMLEEQICKPNASVDPMTVVAKGAALYASTISVSDEIIEETMDKTKVQLGIDNDTSSVESELFVPVKMLKDKMEGTIPDSVFVEFVTSDGSWSSGKVEVNEIGDIIEVQLQEGKMNVFNVITYDSNGDKLECEPTSFNVIQGSVVGDATLPYNIGIEVVDRDSGKNVFKTIKGLEKTKTLPATGVSNGLKTLTQIRPGLKDDFIEISIFQGENDAEGTPAILNHHVNTIYITGEDFPSLLPVNSEVDITLKIDVSQKITGKAYFPYLDFTYDFECETKVDDIETDWLSRQLDNAHRNIEELKQKDVSPEILEKAQKDISKIEEEFNKNKEDTDTKQKTLSNLRKTLKVVEDVSGSVEWPELEKKLKDAFYELEEINQKRGNDQTLQVVEKLRSDVNQAIQTQDKKNTPQLIEVIRQFTFELERLEHLIGFILYVKEEFNSIAWRDRHAATRLINEGLKKASETPSVADLQPIVNDLYVNAQFDKKGNDTGGNGGPPKNVLQG
ncbi:Hsp70 family protein [Aureispira sp. CCB-E]|uniref:Hsp70 family protein n=1 Tax=Aureispira sp. CCB-E TaxID=3051121 RepID=UPI0028697995|nr:Hsp70 family protein [Aureispira sp. CCB-E]WMX16514.1 Hsp70 family protein [Aureispira sp. CCB-E]